MSAHSGTARRAASAERAVDARGRVRKSLPGRAACAWTRQVRVIARELVGLSSYSSLPSLYPITRLNLKQRYADPLRSSVYTSASTFSFFRCRWSPRNRASSPPCDTYTSTFVSFTCSNLYTVPCMA